MITQQAAQILNISRPYLYRLIEEKAVPVVMVGTHRRLRIHDVVELRDERRQSRRRALDQLSDLPPMQAADEHLFRVHWSP